MKVTLFLAFYALAITTLVAQSEVEQAPILSDTFTISQPPQRVVYKMFDLQKPPVYPGGEKELLKFLAENVRYPPQKPESNATGSLAISFVIEADGSMSTKKVLRGGELAESLLKVLDLMPRWSPGMVNGQPVAVEFILPVRIHLE